jgi:bacteriocin-like protein
MKELTDDQLELIVGGKVNCESYAGLAAGATVSFLIIGAATGGLGFVVAGGLTGYFGTIGVLGCFMY